MFDTHCHLQTEQFDQDRDEVLTHARQLGVTHLLIPAIGIDSFSRTLELAQSHNDIYCGLGIHPHNSLEWNSTVRDQIREEASRNPKVRAVGEIGLDYYYDFSPKDVQQRAFREQIELAQELKKPIIIHTRESEDDVYSTVKEYYSGQKDGPTGQFHCFSGTVDLMEKVVSLGFYVSFTGNITFKKSTLTEVVREAPLESILIETDSPYLAPVPYRGKRNSPEYLSKVAEKIAEIKQIEVSQVMQQTFQNAVKLFLSSAAIVLLLCFLAQPDALKAQPGRSNPVGSRPPDSVLTTDARKNEELRKQQLEQLKKEQEQRRQDSLAQVQRDQEEAIRRAKEQTRQDSIKAAERIAEEERERQKALTPITWKAIGIGGAAGIGNMQMSQNKGSLTPTSVLATSLQIGSQITRVIDIEASYSSMLVSDDLSKDSLWNLGLNTPTSRLNGRKIGPGENFPTEEQIKISMVSFDVRFVINPRRAFKYYAGIGYTSLTMENTQKYQVASDTNVLGGQVNTFQSSFNRGAIKVLFGARYDIELGDNFILTPFAQIAAMAAFQGENAKKAFVFRPDEDQITATLFNIGATVYFGWFGVERLKP